MDREEKVKEAKKMLDRMRLGLKLRNLSEEQSRRELETIKFMEDLVEGK